MENNPERDSIRMGLHPSDLMVRGSDAERVRRPADDRPTVGVFIPTRVQSGHMKSTRKALRDGDLYKDNYERLNCSACERGLKKENDPDEVFSVRTCPDCSARFKELR